MKKCMKKLTCLILTVCMLFSLSAEAFAAVAGGQTSDEEANVQIGFDFDASDYSVSEADNLTVTVKRNDAGTGAAVITFKIADLLSEYGTDYVVADANGAVLSRVDGEKPSVSAMTDDDGSVFGTDMQLEDTLPAVRTGSSDSSLMSAVGTYLGGSAAYDGSGAGVEAADAVSELHSFFARAQGAVGQLHFADGETEKCFTVMPVNNSSADGTRLFMIELASVESDDINAALAPNATAYVNLIDDEAAAVRYTIEDGEITLSASAPAAEITIVRTEGTNTFSTVYASTVSDTAPEGSYDVLHLEEIVFLPGETEKNMTVRANDFSVGGSFGIRIESDDGAGFDRFYQSVSIAESSDAPDAVSAGARPGLLAAGNSTVLGDRFSSVDGSVSSSPPIGTASAGLSSDEWNLYDRNKDVSVFYNLQDTNPENESEQIPKYFTAMFANGEAGLSSKSPVNLAGVYNLSVSMGAYTYRSALRGVKHFGLDVASEPLSHQNLNYGHFRTTTQYSPEYDQFFSIKRVFTVKDKVTSSKSPAPSDFGQSFSPQTITTLNYYRVNVASCNDSKYLNFWMDDANCGVEFYGVCMEHTKYTFSPMPSTEYFRRSLYDLGAETNSGTAYHQDTFYEGETTRDYYPAAVSITYTGSPVTGFYSNANKNVVIAPSEPEKVEANGLILKGVYFAKADVAADSVPTGANVGNPAANMLFVPAKNGEIVLALNGDFVKSLVDAGAVSDHNPVSEDIQIFPVYEHEKVTVILKNSGGSEFYNLADFCTGFGDLTAADGDKIYKIENYNGSGEAVYAMEIDKASIVRLWCRTAVDASAHGVCYVPASNQTDVSVSYHKRGTSIASAVTPGGISIYTDDFTRADINVTDDFILYPCIGEQTISLRYFDRYENGIRVPDIYRPDDLTGLAGYVDSSISYDEETGEVRDAETGELIPDYTGISGADGIVTVEALTGGVYSFFVVPPENYCVYWTNMTADLNHDGSIDGETEENAHNSTKNTSNPEYLIGSRLNLVADQDNIQYYYQFVPLGSLTDEMKNGTIVRNSSTFYQLASGHPSTAVLPCANCNVYLADWYGTTDRKGRFSIQTGGLAKSGELSASTIVDDITYNFRISSQRNNVMVELPALYRFTAKSFSAYYGKAENTADFSGAVGVKDDILTIKAEVGNCGTIRPAGAKFEVRSNGFPKYTFSEGEVSFDAGIHSGTACLTFNPMEIIDSGDRIFVSFMDEAGNWYPYIDIGLTFVSQLKLNRIALPIFGATLVGDEAADNSFEILGSTLCDLALDAVGDLDVSNPRLTYPSGVSVGDYADSWYETDYSYSFDTELLPKFGKSSGDKAEKTDDQKKEDLKEDAAKLSSDDTQVKPNSSSKFKTSSSFLWQLDVGIGLRLTISQRTDKSDDSGELKVYFEDMSFYVKAGTKADINASVALPIGVSILFRFQLDAKVVGIYRMYNNYKTDPSHITGTLLYSDFSVFESNEKVTREGYVFIDPKITVTLGVKVGIISVNGEAAFTFDMDFCFGENDDAYGRLDVDLGWAIKLLGFKVYSKNLKSSRVVLFGDDAFDFDAGQGSGDKVQAVLRSTLNNALADGEFALDVPVDRSYLDYSSGWLGNVDHGRPLLAGSGAGSPESEEKLLMTGSATDPYMKLADLGGGKLLMVFIGDDVERTSVNKRAIFYSLSSDGGTTWAAPVLLDDDGTLDDYPDVFDLGNGEVLVTWSSVDTVMPEGSTVVEALSQLNLKTAFFDTKTMTFGDVTVLTKTTEDDFCADVLPHAAYDSETDRIILYYTKTEYDSVSTAEDLGKAESVTAYLFCEKASDKWVWQNTADAYTDEEITSKGLTDEYRKSWYGQRFLDPRIDSSSAIPLIVFSDAVSYNGLALYTWVVDWDNDQNTTNDRDVFVQIYNFSENSFTYPYRVTRETGTYSLPVFVRTGETTYLFFGALVYDTDSDTGDRAESGHGEIRCMNISEAVGEEMYTKYTNGSTVYYNFCYEETDESGSVNTVWVPIQTATDCGSIEDYTAAADGTGRIFILWTDSEGSDCQIYASMISEETAHWSRPHALTSGAKRYGDISAVILNGSIFVGSGRTSSDNESDTALVVLAHEPSSKVVLRSAAVSSEHPIPGETVSVTAVLANDGLLPESGSYEFSVSVNGGTPVAETVDGSFIGGASIEVPVNVVIPDEFDALTYTVTYQGDQIELEYARSAALSCGCDAITESSRADGSAITAYSLDVENSGNAVGTMHMNAYAGDRKVGELDVASIGMHVAETVTLPLDLTDSDYTVAEDGTGTAEITIEVIADGETVYTGAASAFKRFDAAAISALRGFVLPNDPVSCVGIGDEVKISGLSLPENLRVRWESSSDESAVSVGADGIARAGGPGSSTLTGSIVPACERIVIGADGRASSVDAASLVPDYMQKNITARILVLPEYEPGADPEPEEPTELRFTDVPETEFYYDAVSWAVRNNVTAGTSETTFSPDDLCTRAQIVTFLWRAAGEPKPSTLTGTRFTDVVEGSFYEKAVMWAVEKGITNGTGKTTFSPDNTCSRGQAVTFLYRYRLNSENEN